jgi:hypothetical protein
MLRLAILVAVACCAPLHAAEPMPPAAKSESALEQVSARMKGRDQDRQIVGRAYKRHDVTRLRRIARANDAQGLTGGDDWMKDEYAPYPECDTAQRDLLILTGAMLQHTERGGASLAKIVQNEQTDYARSSALCRARLAMQPSAGWNAYAAD